MSSQTAFRAIAGREHMPGIAGASRPSPGSGVKIIAPDSMEWRDLGMGERLWGIPFVESMIRQGKASLVRLPEPTRTCMEKAKAARIGAERIVKTLCCTEAANPGGKVFLVTSASSGRTDLSDICGQHEDLRFTELALAPETLPGMAPGTCTPFVKDAGGVEMFMVQAPEEGLRERLVDVSIGGTDELAFCLSVSLRYGDLVGSLAGAYGDKVRLFSSEVERGRLPGRVEEQLSVLRGDPRHPKRYAPRLKAIRRLEGFIEGSSLDKTAMASVISELERADGPHAAVREEAMRLASKLAHGMEPDS